MAIFYIDSLQHYLTAAQGNTKVDAMEANPLAAQGAFGSPSTQGYYIKNFTPTPTIEVSAYHNTARPGEPFSRTIAHFTTNPVEAHIVVYVTPDGRVVLHRSDYAGFSGAPVQLAASLADVYQFNVDHHLLIQATISDTVGTFDFKIDGFSVFGGPLTGLDTRSNGGSYGLPNAEASVFRLYSGNKWSHLAVANALGDITGQPRVQAVFATADGFHTDFTPVGAGADHKDRINETAPNDATLNRSGTVGHKDSYLFANALVSASRVLAVQFVPRVGKLDAAVHEVRSFYRKAGVDYPLTTMQVPASPAYMPDCRPINPATGVEFTVAEVNAPLEAGLEIVT